MASILGAVAGGGLAAPIEAVGNVIDKLFTSDAEKLDKQAVLNRLALEPTLAQAEINKVEAQHRSPFVAGWRPFIGWVCGVSLAYNFILRDLIQWAILVWSPQMPVPPALQMEHLLTVLLGMLGLGGLRTMEKMTGRAK